MDPVIHFCFATLLLALKKYNPNSINGRQHAQFLLVKPAHSETPWPSAGDWWLFGHLGVQFMFPIFQPGFLRKLSNFSSWLIPPMWASSAGFTFLETFLESVV